MASVSPSRSMTVTERNYGKRMSSHLAIALVLFALLQIGIVAKEGGSLLMHCGIFLAIGGFAVAARNLERRWIALGASDLPADDLDARFRADLIPLWSASLLAPFLWIPVAIVGHFLFG